jgi:hypothetical protein
MIQASDQEIPADSTLNLFFDTITGTKSTAGGSIRGTGNVMRKNLTRILRGSQDSLSISKRERLGLTR